MLAVSFRRVLRVLQSRTTETASRFGSRVSSRAYHPTPAVLGKIIPVNLPDIGEGIAEVEVLQWHVKPGDRVSQFDKLLEVQSDKATVDITSRYDGVVKSLQYKKGDMAKTGTSLLEIDLDGEGGETAAESSPASAAASSPAADVPPTSATSAPSARGLAAPAVRRIAREAGIPVTAVSGTGKDGRVTKEDILKHLSGQEVEPTTASTSSPAPAPAPAIVRRSGPAQDTRLPLRGFARAMVKSMTASWAVPHFGYCEEVVMDPLMNVRASLKGAAAERGAKLTYLPFLLKASSLALSQFPILNGQLAADNGEVILKGEHNIGVAMDTPRGLVVPVVRSVQDRSVWEVAAELARLQAAAAAGKLTEADLSGGTFTLSNIGTIGGTYAAPVIPMGTAAIGALGKIAKSPRYASTLPGHNAATSDGSDALVPAHIMAVSWAADHRYVDGATMARFTRVWKGMIEQPAVMLAQLR